MDIAFQFFSFFRILVNNIADFFHLDDYNDLDVIKNIKKSTMIDPRTKLPLIDDDSLPEWVLTKDKKGKDILRDPDGKPYLSFKMISSLLMGAIRAIYDWLTKLEKRIEKLENK